MIATTNFHHLTSNNSIATVDQIFKKSVKASNEQKFGLQSFKLETSRHSLKDGLKKSKPNNNQQKRHSVEEKSSEVPTHSKGKQFQDLWIDNAFHKKIIK